MLFLEKNSNQLIISSVDKQLVYYSGAEGRYPISDFINGPNVSINLSLNETEGTEAEFKVKPYFKEAIANRIVPGFGQCLKFKGFFNQF